MRYKYFKNNQLQWNSVNPVANGPQKPDHINNVAMLKRFFKF